MGIVYQTTKTLFPRQDRTFAEIGGDILLRELEEHSEYKKEGFYWSLNLEENHNGTARLTITVINKPIISNKREIMLWIALIAFVIIALFVCP